MPKEIPSKDFLLKINRPKELALQMGMSLDVLTEVSKNIKIHYWTFKKDINGKLRDLYDVSSSLKEIHNKIDRKILNRVDYPIEFQGGIKGRSLKSNAQIHSKKGNVHKFDIKGFFPSITPKQVYDSFISLGCKPDVAHLITRLVTADDHVPQGFTTSPKVAAIVLMKTNARLKGLLRGFGANHSFWIDDLNVSGSYPIKKLRPSIRKIFKSEGFKSHKDQGGSTYQSQRQTVTGVVVNTKPSIPKERRLAIEKLVFTCEQMGIRNYRRVHMNKSVTLRELVSKTRGRISHIISIDKPKYQSLNDRWEKLVNNSGL